MINLDFYGDIEDFQKKGYYFRPKSHICKHYIVEVAVKKDEINCVVKIYEIGIPQKDGKELLINNGDEIATTDVDYLLEIDLWGKYFFPKFSEDRYQWYYNQSYKKGEWGFDEDGNMDEILAVAEVMKFSVSIGLKLSRIEKY